jgi:phosphate transport system permease protein
MSFTTEMSSTEGNVPKQGWKHGVSRRNRTAKVWSYVFLAAAFSAVLLLLLLLGVLTYRGWDWLSFDLFTEQYSRTPEGSGFQAAVYGSISLVSGAALIAFVVGVGTAIFLEEYAPRGVFTRVLQINISNLSGVPSVVYGLLGLALFVDILNIGRVILAGALTMGLLILPIIIISSQEAIRNVSLGQKQAAYAVGATRWQVVRHHILPAAMPGILTGTILAVSRAIGETAPLLVVGASAVILFNPSGPFSQYTAMPVQIYQWTSRPQAEFKDLAAAAIIALMAILLSMNGLAIYLRHRLEKNRL